MNRTRFVSAVVTLLTGNRNAGTEEQQIVDTVSTIFHAASTDDVAKFDSVIASDFYIFDGGAWFNGNTLMDLIKAQHAAGRRYERNVTEPDVHISGNTAWIAYINKGSITDALGAAKLNWLESAFLEKRAGGYKISEWDAEALKAIMRNGYSEKHCARRMRNAAGEAVQEAVRDALLSGRETSGRLEYNCVRKTFFINGQK